MTIIVTMTINVYVAVVANDVVNIFVVDVASEGMLGTAISETAVLGMMCREVRCCEIIWCDYYIGNNVVKVIELYIPVLWAAVL